MPLHSGPASGGVLRGAARYYATGAGVAGRSTESLRLRAPRRRSRAGAVARSCSCFDELSTNGLKAPFALSPSTAAVRPEGRNATLSKDERPGSGQAMHGDAVEG